MDLRLPKDDRHFQYYLKTVGPEYQKQHRDSLGRQKVDSTPVFVDPDHFLRGLGLLDSFLVPGENQEGWSQQQPDTSSALASVDVKDHFVPDLQQGF